jgi:hypothetical protein
MPEPCGAEGLDPDDPAVVAAIDVVRWELSLLARVPPGPVTLVATRGRQVSRGRQVRTQQAILRATPAASRR